MIATGGAGHDEWITPEWVWKPWHEVLHFVIDAAATAENHLGPCKVWFSKPTLTRVEESGLDADWAVHVKHLGGGSVWCNPPYSRKGGPLMLWVKKAISESDKGVVVCMLLPADTSTNWFSLLWSRTAGAWKLGVQGYFTDQRVRFIHPKSGKSGGSPTFGSLIVVLSKPLVLDSLFEMRRLSPQICG